MVAAIAPCTPTTWLEPGCGHGVFLQSLSARGIPKASIHAVDLDTKPSEHDRCGIVRRGVDFLSWAANREEKFGCVIGNPPYVAIRELPKPLRSVAAKVLDHRGLAVGARANTWYAFLQASLRLLRENGNLAFVLPASCEYAGYSEPGRAGIMQVFERVDLIRSDRPLFADVQEGAAILICQNKGSYKGVFRRHEVSGISETIERLLLLNKLKARVCPENRASKTRECVRLGDVISIKLGGVTGDANYFVISEERRRALHLPIQSVQPVLAKCRHIQLPWITTNEWYLLKAEGRRVWIFNPQKSVVENPSVRSYLELHENKGGCRRRGFKICHRNPWYRTPMPERPDGFISGMATNGVWICINEMPSLNATNTLYVCYFKEDLEPNQRFACALGLLTSECWKRLRRSRRRYADGLEKIEPGQLADLELPSFGHVKNAKQVYCMALASFLRGDSVQSRSIADAAFRGDACFPCEESRLIPNS